MWLHQIYVAKAPVFFIKTSSNIKGVYENNFLGIVEHKRVSCTTMFLPIIDSPFNLIGSSPSALWTNQNTHRVNCLCFLPINLIKSLFVAQVEKLLSVPFYTSQSRDQKAKKIWEVMLS